MDSHRISDATYARAISSWNEEGLIELVSVVGYYCLVSLTLNAFDVALPDHTDDPFPDVS
jgi:4-carboxymuconolactone decarboxylase